MLLNILAILLNVLWWIIIVQAVMSWLIAFNVINTHNEFVGQLRSEEHTSELQSLMRISYAVFCLKKKKRKKPHSQYINTYKSLRHNSISTAKHSATKLM